MTGPSDNNRSIHLINLNTLILSETFAMGTKVKPSPSNGSDYKPAPAGNHLTICVGVVDMGHHWEEWEGKGSWKPKIRLVWELCDELMEDGRPFTLSRTFNLSLHENAGLRKFLEPWRGKFTDSDAREFDVKEMLGKPCMLTVAHNQDKDGKTWANVMSAAPLPKRVTAPQPANDLLYYSTDDGPPPADMPERLRNRILESKEFKGTRVEDAPVNFGPPPEADDDSDPPPF